MKIYLWIILGLISLILGFYLPISRIQWTILLLIGFCWYLFNTLRRGKLKFWKLVGHNPEEAYKYFKEHEDVWKVVDTDVSKFVNDAMRLNKNYKKDWTGPYRLYVPSVGIVHIYGKSDVYEQEQERLVSLLHNKEKGVLNDKSENKGFVQIPVLIAIILGIILVGGASYVGIQKMSTSRDLNATTTVAIKEPIKKVVLSEEQQQILMNGMKQPYVTQFHSFLDKYLAGKSKLGIDYMDVDHERDVASSSATEGVQKCGLYDGLGNSDSTLTAEVVKYHHEKTILARLQSQGCP